MMELVEDTFDFLTNKTTGEEVPIRRFTWKNPNGIIIQVINYGGIITSIKLPDKQGVVEDIVLGFDNIKGYLKDNPHPYFGATIGRCANRIAESKFIIDDVIYHVTPNISPNHLHGGLKGFDRVLWNHYVIDKKLFLSYLSKDGEEGYPGDVLTTVTFELTEKNEFKMEFKATTTKPTIVNLTNHSYFNLAGDNAGSKELYQHKIAINADNIADVDNNSIPTGQLLPVINTNFDLRIARILGDVINNVPKSPLGYDHNYCLNKAEGQDIVFVGSAHHPKSGRILEVYTNQPGVQFYTANFLPNDESLIGKKGHIYKKHGAFCLETQNYPDAVNQRTFPEAILYPGQQYHHILIYKFSVDA